MRMYIHVHTCASSCCLPIHSSSRRFSSFMRASAICLFRTLVLAAFWRTLYVVACMYVCMYVYTYIHTRNLLILVLAIMHE